MTEKETKEKAQYIRAVKMFSDNYEKAKTLEFVRNPLCYALYETWKFFDKENDISQCYRCRDCKWHCGEWSSIGTECVNPKKQFRTRTSKYKYNHTRACTQFEKKEGI